MGLFNTFGEQSAALADWRKFPFGGGPLGCHCLSWLEFGIAMEKEAARISGLPKRGYNTTVLRHLSLILLDTDLTAGGFDKMLLDAIQYA
ncbi:hypothetical protein A3197_07910 [Candidatus Thiodiazotropha endoloripes]|nr:hypothetical protein A3197_07910 [Candidatus Thiodiazotropha endoloripes]